jgi:hypothetical protein
VERLDGNAIAGLLWEVFGAELTVATGVCDGCGASELVGALHVYRAAGVVVRCPHCDNVLVRVVRASDRTWVDLSGLRVLELPA